MEEGTIVKEVFHYHSGDLEIHKCHDLWLLEYDETK